MQTRRRHRCRDTAVAVFKTPRVHGTVVGTEGPDGVRLDVTFTRLPPGQHGFHIHTAGDLRGEGCQGACAHYHVGPPARHGGPHAHERHTGDLGNVACTRTSPFHRRYTLSGVRVSDLWGRSAIVHADPDDLGKGSHADSGTTGHSGKRIACAIFGRGKTNSAQHGAGPEGQTAVALDCEMVGVGRASVLAEVVVVDETGAVLYHAYVRPPGPVTDYRTAVSGITANVLETQGQSFTKVQKAVAELLKGKILVGHALINDLKALRLTHPTADIRDSAEVPGFKTMGKFGILQPQKLQTLAAQFLGRRIQEGAHDPAEDARTAMDLYLAYPDMYAPTVRHAGPLGPPRTRRRRDRN